MKNEIFSVQIITSTGAGTLYEVGSDGVTYIDVSQEQIGEYEFRYVYRIYKNEDLYVCIAYNCPVEVIYKTIKKL